MAEIESYHAQKVEDFASLAKEHLDGEIEFYEQVSFLFFFQACPTFRDQLCFYATHLPSPSFSFFLTFKRGRWRFALHNTQVLLRLRTARRTFEPPIYPRLSSGGMRQPSIYERDLDHPRLNPDPLPQPCPHVWDATPMRPVSHAIQEGVGLLLGGAANAVTGRGSVFGRFW